MNILYLSPEFPPNFQNFIKRAKDLGHNIFALGEADFYSFSEELRRSIFWYERVNLNHAEEVKQRVQKILSKMEDFHLGKIDYVESHNEHWLKLEAFLNTEFQISGIKNHEIALWKKKSEMKKAILDAKIKVHEGEIVTSLKMAKEFSSKVKYPVILKPDEGVGAQATYKIQSETELEHLFPSLNQVFFIEKFVEGVMVTYDGLTDLDGNVIFHNSLVYSTGVLDNVQGNDTFFHSRREISNDLLEIGQKLVKRFNIKRKFFHIELFETKNGIIPLEVNVRAPGGPILDLFNYSSDCDLYEAWGKVLQKNPPHLLVPKKYFCAYAGRKNRAYIHSHEEIMKEFHERIVEHRQNPPLFAEAMGRYAYIFRTKTEEELFKIKHFILKAQ